MTATRGDKHEKRHSREERDAPTHRESGGDEASGRQAVAATRSTSVPPRVVRADEVMRALREEVHRRRAVGGSEASRPQPAERLPRLDLHTNLQVGDRLDVSELLAHDDESFIINAYRALLGRDPDGDGWTANLVRLRTGERGKVEILGRVRYSKEGRQRKVPVRGLFLRFAATLLYRVPLVGSLLSWPIEVIRLPSTLRALEAAEARQQHRFNERAHLLNRALDRIDSEIADLPDATRRGVEVALVGHPLSTRVSDLEGAAEDWASEDAVAALAERAEAVERAISELRRRKAETNQVDQLSGGLESASRRLDELGLHAARTGDLQTLAERLGGVSEQLVQVDARARLAERVPDLLGAIETLQRDAAMRATVEPLSAAVQELVGADGRSGRLAEMDSRLAAQGDDLRAHNAALIESDQRAQVVTEELRKELEAATRARSSSGVAGDYGSLWADIYPSLEDRFRGERDQIRHRLGLYVPYAQAAVKESGSDICWDLGSGRGEWLEIVREEGWAGTGIDCNERMAEGCREMGLDVIVEDAITHLRAQVEACASVVTAFHLLEHLQLDELLGVVVETNRVLRSGGVAIFESPNPENLVVGACNFYTDPTHRNPLYPATLGFILEQCGFVDVEVLRPAAPDLPEWLKPVDPGDPLAERLNPLLDAVQSWFAASPDFAVIGRKS